jgi:hypothetical protein
MNKNVQYLPMKIEEYKTLLPCKNSRRDGTMNWKQIEKKLHTECKWTPAGAQILLTLARQYGSFVLNNALALSIALGIEDGELGL